MHVQPATTMVAVVPMMPAIPVMVPMPVMSAVIAVMMAPTVMDGNDASASDQRDSGKQHCDEHFSDFHIRNLLSARGHNRRALFAHGSDGLNALAHTDWHEPGTHDANDPNHGDAPWPCSDDGDDSRAHVRKHGQAAQRPHTRVLGGQSPAAAQRPPAARDNGNHVPAKC